VRVQVTLGNCHIVSAVFTPVLAKHTNNFNLIDTLSHMLIGFREAFTRYQQPSSGMSLSPVTAVTEHDAEDVV
jgi:hypothetical protein